MSNEHGAGGEPPHLQLAEQILDSLKDNQEVAGVVVAILNRDGTSNIGLVLVDDNTDPREIPGIFRRIAQRLEHATPGNTPIKRAYIKRTDPRPGDRNVH